MAATGLVSSAFAGSVSGTYTYSYAGTTAGSLGSFDCGAMGADSYDTFTGLGADSVAGTSSILFSACNVPTSGLAVGTFAVSDGLGDAIDGTFEGTGAVANVESGVFTITSETGIYTAITDTGGVFQDTITGGLGVGTGNFSFQSAAPEPFSMFLAGTGIALVGLKRKFQSFRK